MIKRDLLQEEIISPNEFSTYQQTTERSALANVPLKFSIVEEFDYDVPYMPCDNDLNLITTNSKRI
ncbi:hypothetical protein Arnit_2435 [Arcobacter nitrofigilis DSM 7299]|uniref:Uncharacterized protein n=1 Tax=Arcobacter nitrofigilis (strain ATCC 33309 / DSM 7299 / CCUG 15893 / LMG 7604 / NCTC 12251 / CI) TaxID=572480 RepID=D5V1C3_ARCNC|nr:hypothetical protein Arnit_2435 [Arcobacter nitrofigilis DSM 7299]